MYWFLNGEPVALLPFLVASAAWLTGGWLIATHAYRIPSRERVLVGAGIGLSLFLFFANWLGRWLPTGWGFALAAACVLALGLMLVQHDRKPLLDLADWREWRLVLALAALTLFLTLMGRGLAILDDRKNLSLISLMAAGDIPPHFYMDSSVLFKYHYGSQLLGAALMRLGGLFPWSALDLSKGILGGLAIVLTWVVGRRMTHSAAGGWALAVLLTFGSGTRWLLLLLPSSWVQQASQTIQLWGSGADTASNLAAALTSPWAVGGGPPVPIPFAFVNGVIEPFVIGIQAGTVALARVILMVLLLTLRRERGWRGAVVWAALIAQWALTWESDVFLFGAALVGLAAFSRFWRRGAIWSPSLGLAAASVLAGGLIALLQGGTLTEMARGLLWPSAAGGGSTSPFLVRWPPAIVSAHLGELHLNRPWELMVAFFEMGPALAAAPLVTWLALRQSALRRYEQAALALSAPLGVILPCFLVYSVDRDITRFSSFGLAAWLLLAVPILWAIARWRRQSRIPAWGLGAGILAVFGGIVILGSLLTALARPVFSEAIAPVDAAMARKVWDRLPRDAIVFDSHPYRAVILTGRGTRSTTVGFNPIPDWAALVASPDPTAIARAGYGFVYADGDWWSGLSEAARQRFATPCVKLVASAHDNARNGDRWLYDVTACTGS